MTDEGIVDRIAAEITERPGRIVVAFLLVTLVFAGGLANVSTSAGTQQFTSGIPAEQALSDIQREFGPSFSEDTGSTQLVQRNRNVLSKPAMLRMLRAQQRLQETQGLRVAAVSSPAATVARTLDPTATTTEAQIRALERATPTEIDRAIRSNADNPGFTGGVSDDFNAESASASAAIGVVTHQTPGAGGGGGAAAGQSGSSPLTDIQLRSQRIVDTVGGDITVFGSGIISAEFSSVITDSLLIVTPAAVLLIAGFLIVAYRDLLDLLLGAFTLVLAVVWTFGFLGLAGIPFSQLMIAVPPLLLAVGIDFGIHAVNRYREDREDGYGVDEAMGLAVRQLVVAFFIVTGTTVIGFLANLTSDLTPIREFGLVAAAGIVFTFLLFGVFLPAAKVLIDRRRERLPIPTFSQAPLGAEGSGLASVLRVGVSIGERGPRVFLALVLVLTAASGGYAAGISTSFSQEDFLPPEDTADYLEALPEPFAPSEYTAVETLNFLEAKFTASQGGSVTIYVEGDMEDPTRLEEIYRMGEDPPSTFVSEGGRAESRSIVTVIKRRAASDPEFRRLVNRNDRNANGVPDDNLGEIYDYLLSSSSHEQALQYLAEDRRSTRVVYSAEADVSQSAVAADGREVADRYRDTSGIAVATGTTVVFAAVSDLIFASAVQSLAVALALTVVFLVVIYGVLEGLPSLGVVNTVPIVASVALVAATMRLAGIAFNAFTATILSLTIGLGIDYSVHVVHRFIDERGEHDLVTALERTVRGTGGALLGSMLTTTTGIGVLVFSVLSILGQFGTLTALSILYSFVTSMVVLPSALVIWDGLKGHDPDQPVDAESVFSLPLRDGESEATPAASRTD
ncbi:efflux RND transporter permease subunit [Halobaculum gomorrense]|uniref:Hydrophobe/amphiphile efflux-3 (HAE3) family protein n=1 Tax=Halobaculum gomorrense TaxID=43928 RepID=A0A1M5N5K3_9EURY|nr:MMPL family transporter [Halobaculum gomorrense]SHG84735.1 hydrophobe/amphiphile efflux-3 (HAE3) family protein [Halobaculum gomorrense]